MWQKTGVGSRLCHVKNPLFVLCKPMKSLGLRQLSIFYCFELLVLKLTCKCLKISKQKTRDVDFKFLCWELFFCLGNTACMVLTLVLQKKIVQELSNVELWQSRTAHEKKPVDNVLSRPSCHAFSVKPRQFCLR